MRPFSALLFVWACATAPPPPATTAQAPPPGHPLTVADVVLAGEPTPLTLRVGGVGWTWGILAARTGSPGTACPQALHPQCLAIGTPYAILASGRAASTTVSATWTPPRAGRVTLQAASIGPTSTDVTGIRLVLVLDGEADHDGDGLTNRQELAMGWDPRVADADDDGLLDGEEYALGSDPNDPDTDRDGLRDGDEPPLGADPTRPDTDADGLTDGQEVARGTDPANPDTDGDLFTDRDEVDRGSDPLDPRDPLDAAPVDTGTSDTASPRPCLEGELRSCWGRCVPDTRADGTCDRWLDCPRYYGDRLDCEAGPPQPLCPTGTILGCWGACEPLVQVGDGTCDPALACPMRGWDGGDCPSPTGPRHVGSVRVASAADVSALAGIVEVEGTLEIAAGAPDPLVLPDLVAVSDLRVTGPGPSVVHLPALTLVDGVVELGGPNLRQLDAPALTVIVRGLNVVDAPAFEDLSLPALERVGHNVAVASAPRLTDVSLPRLQSAAGLVVRGPTAAARVHLPALTHLRGDVVLDGATLGEVELPALFALDGEVILRDAVAQGLRAPALSSALRLSGDLTVPEVDLSGVTHVEALVATCHGPCRFDLSSAASATSLVVDGPAVELWLHQLEQAVALRVDAGTEPVALPLLGDVTGGLSVTGASLDASALTTCADAYVDVTGAADLSGLVSAGAVDLTAGAPRLDALATATRLEVTLTAASLLDLPALVALDPQAPWPPDCCGGPSSRGGLKVRGPVGASVRASALVQLAVGDLAVGAAALPALDEALRLTIATDLDAPSLRRVGRLTVAGGAARPNVPSLVEVASLILGSGAPPAVTLTDLERATSILVTSPTLLAMSLPNLERVGARDVPPWAGTDRDGDGVQVLGAALQALSLPALRRTSTLIVRGGALAAIDLPEVDDIGRVELREAGDPAAWWQLQDVLTDGLTTAPPTTSLHLELPALRACGGFDVVHDRRVASLSLPALTTLTGRLRVHDAPSLQRVALAALEQTGPSGWINLMNLPSLSTVDLPRAHTLARLASVNTGLEVLSAPALVHLHDHLTAYDNAVLREVRAPLLTATAQVYLDNNTTLATVDLPLLAYAGALWLVDNPTVANLTLPALAEIPGAVEVRANDALAVWPLPALGHAGSVRVSDNGSLDPCLVEAALNGVVVDGALILDPPCTP